MKVFFVKQTFVNEEIKTQLADLISNIGGFLGLFLGLSFLSLIEFVEILIQIVLILLGFHFWLTFLYMKNS